MFRNYYETLSDHGADSSVFSASGFFLIENELNKLPVVNLQEVAKALIDYKNSHQGRCIHKSEDVKEALRDFITR